MSRPSLIPQAKIAAALEKLSGWKLADDGKAIERRFKFADFSEAFAFMARGALAAEKLDHHPEWSNVYNRVDVRLSTHDAGGVTSLDIELAGLLDKAGLRAG
jgi:4a-hydroxytetrahydrobiopterin dehydratase